MIWTVIRTRSRHEKAVASAAERADLEAFVPTYCERRQHGNRYRDVEMPLLGCYLFVNASREGWFEAMSGHRGVAQVLDVPDQDKLNDELTQLREAVRRRGALSPHPYLYKGHRVRVRSGPFRGIEGVVAELREHNRLILNISALSSAACLEVAASDIERV